MKGPERGPEGDPEAGPEVGPEGGPEGGSRFCLHPIRMSYVAVLKKLEHACTFLFC